VTAGARRIVLIGCGGAGKSRLARRIATRIGAPAIILDDIWQPGWGPENVPAFRELVRETHRGGAWISDGNFAVATFDLRLPRADLIVWLDTPRWLCAWRAIRRPFARGEPHRVSGIVDVLRFIWNFDRVNRPRIEALRAQIAPGVPVMSLRTTADVDAFIESLVAT